ncbi:hypothetical protein ACIBEJ_00745 [Nonomuraea sp. NPDC050790]|uniref:hypothetical protein n=1 Tax=Nonomuraea sp. NPDC050790 TaxID=3364371 RepID=UPI00378B7383
MPKQDPSAPASPGQHLALATCTYQEFLPLMGLPVRTTVGLPRFALAYQLAGHAKLITPRREFLGRPRDAYTLLYRRHLDAIGVGAIHAELTGIAATHEPGRPLVLLCFDRFDKLTPPDDWCHRTLFADWWKQHVGDDVPELGAQPTIPPPTLFDLAP